MGRAHLAGWGGTITLSSDKTGAEGCAQDPVSSGVSCLCAIDKREEMS